MSKLLANQIANFGDDAPIEIKEGLNIPAGKPLQAAGFVGNSGQVLTSTGATIQWATPFDGDYNSLTGRPTIPPAQIQPDWNATSGLGSILNKPTVPPSNSVVTNVAGSASLTFNAANGQFTYTPPDLSGFAANTNVSNWDAAYSWGDHGTEGYLVATNTDKTNWNTAFGWGDHGTAGYLTSYTETSTFQNVIDRGNTSTSPVYVSNKLYFSNVFATLGDLQAVNATTYHGMFAHAHDTGHGYFAHSNAWKQLIDEASSIDELGDVDTTTVSPSDGYVLKWEASSNSWKPAPDLVGTSNAGITLVDLSVNNVAAGTSSLSYSNTTGVFTYTPPDLSGYLTTETDPVFINSPSFGITSPDIANWDTAYGWGNHASAGYLTSALQNVEEDTTPVLGGTLDINNKLIVGTGGGTSKTKISDNTGYFPGGFGNYSGNATIGWTFSNDGEARCRIDGTGPNYGAGVNAITIGHFGNLSTFTIEGTGDLKTEGSLNVIEDSDTVGAGSKLTIGSSGQLEFFHTSDNNSTIKSASDLKINADKLWLQNKDGNEPYIECTDNGSVKIYHDFFPKLETDQNGIKITGGIVDKDGDLGTAGQILSSTGTELDWIDPPAGGGGGGGANVTVSDTPPGSATAGDLWWESDTGRLKIRYQDVDSAQWVDASPPLADATTIGASGTVSMKAHILPDTNAAWDIGSAEYKIRHLFLSDNTLYHEGPFIKTAQHDAGGSAQTASYVITLAKLKEALNASSNFDDFKSAILAITDA